MESTFWYKIKIQRFWPEISAESLWGRFWWWFLARISSEASEWSKDLGGKPSRPTSAIFTEGTDITLAANSFVDGNGLFCAFSHSKMRQESWFLHSNQKSGNLLAAGRKCSDARQKSIPGHFFINHERLDATCSPQSLIYIGFSSTHGHGSFDLNLHTSVLQNQAINWRVMC